MRLIALILVSLMLGASGHANSNDKTLWGKSLYGMTPAQVLKAFPTAQKNPTPQTVPLTNSQSHVIILNQRIYDLEFNIDFYFNHQGLVQVTLVAKRASRERINLIESLLDEKYGEPIDTKSNSVAPAHVDYETDRYSAPLSVGVVVYGESHNLKLLIIYGHSRYDIMNSL
tara:strand:+ start:68 stop:580 length:513 start_codon:yes stop_codon:yes gene_type:complete